MSAAKQIIIVRSLTDSDLGLFAAHRVRATSKQRAININAPIARELFGPGLIEAGEGVELDCLCVFGAIRIRSARHCGKVNKNWRLGGKKIEGAAFAELDSKDFVLIRSVAGNDGSAPLLITFIGKTTDRVVHAGIAAMVGNQLNDSMTVVHEGDSRFVAMEEYCSVEWLDEPTPGPLSLFLPPKRKRVSFAPMPRENPGTKPARPRTIEEKIRTPHILERMLRVSGDLSAPAQLRFMDTVRQLAGQLRKVLTETRGIVTIRKDHQAQWRRVAGKPIGFVDGGLANLSMLGSAPVAARVGGYIVRPGEHGSDREEFTVLKCLIDELYAHSEGGVYTDTFPDVGALRDAARISIEAAGAVRMLAEKPDLAWVMVHGALVNPVSRYTDVMKEGRVRHRFPDFSASAVTQLLPPGDPPRKGRDRNFISVHLRQLQLMQRSDTVVCGVIEREGTTASVCRAVLDSLDDEAIGDVLPKSPEEWKRWFRSMIDPSGDEDYEGQRINDSLLFSCVLEPGEALVPVPVDRNDERRAPEAWKKVLVEYPKPCVSYLQTTEWSAPTRFEMFDKDLRRFESSASLIMHCAWLLPRYAFPVGLDIVDKFAKIPDWISRSVNTRTAVLALRKAMDSGDSRLFDSLRRMLCGSSREWLLRPGIYR